MTFEVTQKTRANLYGERCTEQYEFHFNEITGTLYKISVKIYENGDLVFERDNIGLDHVPDEISERVAERLLNAAEEL
ncbi:hypothetical protein [Natrinema sp. DC36]|uniref:hypothetical protein n=1 Tax=Natrinema sp. DC36 TaxID=2878680 RepID=UPI001CF09886|nr:hypothetical protein [Natrinema sp. DC36]